MRVRNRRISVRSVAPGKYQFILDEPPSPKNWRTGSKYALAAESKAYIRNMAFARQADREGYPQISRLFRAVAQAESVHASEYLKYLEGYIGTTEENLAQAFEKRNTSQHPVLRPPDQGGH